MENVTTPGQVLFLGVLFCMACLAIWWWLRAGVPKDTKPVDFNPAAIIGDTWAALLHWRSVPKAREPAELDLGGFPLPAAPEPYTNGSGTAPELYLNAAEVAALNRMIKHNATAAKPSKSSTIQAGFGVSRGGSPAYARASLIYDALFGAPAPAIKYRERTPEQEALRQQLRLEKQ